MEKVPVYILAGGNSRRFGEDKARAVLDGLPLITRVAQCFAPVASSITVVADRAGKYRDLGLRAIGDLAPGLGPMGGLRTALSDCAGDQWLLLTCCDRIGVRLEWIESLMRLRRSDARIIAFQGSRWEPFPALYHSDILPEVAARIAEGDRALWRLMNQVAHVAVPQPESWHEVKDINTRQDLEEFNRCDEAV